jgi:hypothetical protein
VRYVPKEGKKVRHHTSVQGMESKVKFLTPLGGDSVLATIEEYTVVRREWYNGTRVSFIDSVIHRLELFTPAGREVIHVDTNRQHKGYCNAIALANGRYAAGFLGGDSIRQCMVIIEADRSAQYIDEPEFLSISAYATHMHQGPDGRLYCFYRLYSVTSDLWAPGAIVYDETTGTTQFRPFANMIQVNHAINLGSTIVAADDRGLLIFDDDKQRFITTITPDGIFYAKQQSIVRYDAQTLLTFEPWGLRYFDVGELQVSSVQEDRAGVVIGSDGQFIVDPSYTATWELYDVNGRIVLSGIKQEGEREIMLTTDHLPQGVYTMVIQRHGRIVESRSVLIQRN